MLRGTPVPRVAPEVRVSTWQEQRQQRCSLCSEGPQEGSCDPEGKAAQHASSVTAPCLLLSEKGQDSAPIADSWSQSPPPAPAGSQEQPPPLSPPCTRRDETHGHPGTRAQCFLPLPALCCCPATQHRPPASPAGSRWLPPPLQASPSAAAGASRAWQQMEGPQQQLELHREHPGRAHPGRAHRVDIRVLGRPWPGSAARCHPAPITPSPSVPGAYPFLPPTFVQPESSKLAQSESCQCQDTPWWQPQGEGPAAPAPVSSALDIQCQ